MKACGPTDIQLRKRPVRVSQNTLPRLAFRFVIVGLVCCLDAVAAAAQPSPSCSEWNRDYAAGTRLTSTTEVFLVVVADRPWRIGEKIQGTVEVLAPSRRKDCFFSLYAELPPGGKDEIVNGSGSFAYRLKSRTTSVIGKLCFFDGEIIRFTSVCVPVEP